MFIPTYLLDIVSKKIRWCKFLMSEGRNFERPIFRNFKIANVKSYERSSYSIFLNTELFFHFFNDHSNTQILVFFQF